MCPEAKEILRLLYPFRFGRHLKFRNQTMILFPVKSEKKILLSIDIHLIVDSSQAADIIKMIISQVAYT